MITTTQQRNKIAARVNVLREQLDVPAKKAVPAHMVEVGRAQLLDSINALQVELDEYDAACVADIHNLNFDTYTDFLKMPIKLRLGSGQTLPEFAKNVGVSESQLKRYEAQEYANAPSKVVDQILKTFNCSVQGQVSRTG